MSKLKNKVKQDFINKTGVQFSFDTTKLESNAPPHKKRFNRNWLYLIIPSATVASLVLVVSAVVLSTMLTSKESVRITRKQYSKAEIAVIESNTFKRLNEFAYPPLDGSRYEMMNEREVEHFNTFTNTIYQALDDTPNSAFVPVNLYPLLSVLSMGSSSLELDSKFAELFSDVGENERTSLYKRIFKNNFYHNNYGSSFIHNGAFVDFELGFSNVYLEKLTNNYFEAFSLDYKNEDDIQKMMKWIDDSMQEENFIKRHDLNITNESILYLFSSFLFSNQWSNKYYEKDNIIAPFYLASGSQTQTTYMSHKYYGKYYNYENYVSVYDYYTNENSVQYIVPKDHSDNIYDLLGDTNFLIETGEEHPEMTIDLTAPIFTNTNTLDFKNALTNLGLGAMFDSMQNNFTNVFDTAPVSSFIEKIIQKNEASFTVDGTTIKSLAFAGADSAGPGPNDTLEVDLNQPFIYVIRDINNIPLFIGHYDTPSI